MTAALLHKLAAALLVCTSQTPPWRNSTAKDELMEGFKMLGFFCVRSPNCLRISVSHCSQFLYGVIGCSKRSQTDLLWELSEAGLGQQWDVTQQLVARVPWWRKETEYERWQSFNICVLRATHGSGVYKGSELCRTYWVQWKTRKAKPARKSRGDR